MSALAPPPTSTQTAESWDGPAVARALGAAADWLRAHRERLNALNVYPVPDGDTGTNMSLTVDAASDAAAAAEGGVDAVFAAAAHAAVMGSRGNSGVILSQILTGFAEGVQGSERLGIADLTRGFDRAAARARDSVINPVEGTLLTAIREAAEAVQGAAPGSLAELLEIAESAAEESVRLSPQRLPRLREAGVVDAGAEGLRLILEALTAWSQGRALDPASVPQATEGALALARAAHPESDLGYCTELVVRGGGNALDDARNSIARLGNSAIVVAEGDDLRVHVHTEHPGAVLECALSHGALDAVKIENMDRQHQAHLAQESAPATAVGPLAVVAVASGAGFRALFRSIGAVVLDGGDTMNPSVQQLADALRRAPAGPIALLANNKNVVPAARQAATAAGRAVHVFATDSQARGVAALFALSEASDADEAVARLNEAIDRVHVVEVTRARRAARVDGVDVRSDDYLALVNGKAFGAGPDPIEVAMSALASVDPRSHELLTVYLGAAGGSLRDALVEAIGREYAELSVDTVDGGQPHYPLILALE